VIADLARRLELVSDADIDTYLAEHGDDGLDDARILIVDDDASSACLMLRLLERDGFRRVESVGDARQALVTMLEHPPEVLVLDVHMPHVDGYTVLREMLSGEERVNTVTGVLAVSGDHSAATCRAMLCGGADDYLPRPFDGTEFALRVRRLAHVTRELRRALRYIGVLESRIRHLTDIRDGRN
jgi:putative two-component system response regulator